MGRAAAGAAHNQGQGCPGRCFLRGGTRHHGAGFPLLVSAGRVFGPAVVAWAARSRNGKAAYATIALVASPDDPPAATGSVPTLIVDRIRPEPDPHEAE